MSLSPAVVSKRISLLEERLGARLFQRTTRQLSLTETGEGFFKRVIDILNLVEEAEDFVSRRNTSPKGLLKISAPTSFTRMHIAPHLPEFFDRFPEIDLDIHTDDNFVDIIREGFDVAIRIGELKDSTMVARKLAPVERVICAAPSYLDKAGAPQSLQDLDYHNCLTAGAQEHWRLDGPDGGEMIRVRGQVRTNCGEVVRELLLSGYGLALGSIWEVGPELNSGQLKIVLPQYRGSAHVALNAVYPSRDFMPAKVNSFIEFLADLYGNDPYWNDNVDLAAVS